jgi:hypothetical protein
MHIIGHVDSISRSFVRGWAIDKNGAADPTPISILVNGKERGACVANRPRPGLAEATAGAASDHCEFRFEFDPPLSVFEEQRIRIVATLTGAPLGGGERTLPAPPAPTYLPGPLPILVTSTGRSGSTLLMSEFANHPDIVVADRYPFEIKHIAYYAAVFRTLVIDSDRARSTHPDTMLSSKNRLIGANPYHAPGFFNLANPKQRLQEFYEAHIPAELATLFRRLVLEFYEILAASQDKPRAPFFSEKGDINPACRQATRLFFGDVKEIAVVRDPRDLLCSAIAFWKLPPDDALAMLKTTLPELEAIARSPAADTILVRYEDLVLDGARTRRTMAEFLDLDLQRGGEAKPVTGAHRTSSNPAASVGRWKADLTPAQIAACDEAFGSYMKQFDYQPALGPARTARPSRFHPPGAPGLSIVEGEAALARLANASLPTAAGSAATWTFGKTGNGGSLLGEGWSIPEDGYIWSNGPESHLRIQHDSAGACRVHVLGAPFVHSPALPSQSVELLCNGEPIGTATLRDVSALSFDLPAAAIGRPVLLTLRLPDATCPLDVKGGTDGRRLGFALRRLVMAPAPPQAMDIAAFLGPPLPITAGCGAPPPLDTPAPADIDLSEARALMMNFESIGENCEFGLVQRKVGAEPPGLLRFSSTPLPKLMEALATGFAGMGAPGSLVVEQAPKEYMVFDKRFGFRYHAWVKLGEMSPAAIIDREQQQLPGLISAFKAELATARKIFVYHGMKPMTDVEALSLHAAMRRYGPATLLWVELADDANPPGSIMTIAPGLLKGYIDRFAPGENAYDFSLNCWVTICRNACLQPVSA